MSTSHVRLESLNILTVFTAGKISSLELELAVIRTCNFAQFIPWHSGISYHLLWPLN